MRSIVVPGTLALVGAVGRRACVQDIYDELP
jgi:hypothetical protein